MTRHLKIEGMSCQHCVQAVEHALSGVAGAQQVRVELGAAWVDGDCDAAALSEALDEAGFILLSAEQD